MKLLCLLLLLVAYVTVQGHWTEQSHDEALSILPEEVADPVTNVALKDSIQSALSGYDIVKGAPLNLGEYNALIIRNFSILARTLSF